MRQATRTFGLISRGGLLLVAASTVVLLPHRGSAGGERQASAEAGIAVTTARARARDMPIYLVGLGTVTPLNSVLVRARVDGQLDKIAFTEGQDVQRGELLAQLDPQPFEAQLRQAEAVRAKDELQLANAQLDLKRYTDAIHRGAVSTQILDTAKAQAAQLAAQVKADDAAIDAARVQLAYATIRAPVAGRTGARLVDAGNMVRATDANGIVLINQIHPIAVTFTLPAAALPRIRARNRDGELSVLAQRRDDAALVASGKLVLIDNQIDTATATIKLKAQFDNADGALWPGEFVDARLVLETKLNAVTVPSQAVNSGPKGDYVFVVKADRTVDLRSVKVIATDADVSAIETGLAAGEDVVVEGQFKLEAGSRVHAVAPAIEK